MAFMGRKRHPAITRAAREAEAGLWHPRAKPDAPRLGQRQEQPQLRLPGRGPPRDPAASDAWVMRGGEIGRDARDPRPETGVDPVMICAKPPVLRGRPSGKPGPKPASIPSLASPVIADYLPPSSMKGRAMGINNESDVTANLQIGPTTLGMVRIFIEGDGIDLPMDFDPEEAEDIAEELRAAAAAARKMARKR